MGTTKQSQKQKKKELDAKLALSRPTREILEELAVACANNPSPDNTFQYAFCLSKSDKESELRYAVTILDGLVKEGYEHQIDCMYGAATALYLLREYDEARSRCESILRNRPDSRLASEMHLACIAAAEQEEAERVKKMAVGGTAAIAAIGVLAGVAGMMMSNKR